MSHEIRQRSGRERLGFRDGERGTHSSRALMLDDLRALLTDEISETPNATAPFMEGVRQRVVAENTLGKATRTNREHTARKLKALYGLDAKVPVFRALSRLWPLDEASQPLLALLCAYARDPLLRIGAPAILLAPVGAIVTPAAVLTILAKGLEGFADKDGIVCLPAVGGEEAAAGRLIELLEAAYGDAWSVKTRDMLIETVGAKDKGLGWWLREKFFEEHCKLFQHRPFVWQVWDGQKDGFSALVNYHRLDRKGLESLTFAYLGDWISRQKSDLGRGISGAEGRYAAARSLQDKLKLILDGERPYDLFVRWKTLAEQPIGWNPDLNDGVRMNIRPFVTAEVLRHNGKPKLNVAWEKDRGKDVTTAPWYDLGPRYGGSPGDRINDHHLSLAEKEAARTASARKGAAA